MMKASTRVSASATSTMKTGTLLGIGAYSLWGLFPLYWKQLASVPAVQVLAHRIMWSFLCTSIALLFFPKARSELAALFRSPNRLFAIAAAGVLISVNWGIYIWAINASRIVESSMGYYLNPLVSVLLGALIFKEKIDRGMILAGFIALCGIMILIVSYGRLPWVALSLAFSFALYGAIKKLAGLSGLAGLAAETSVVAPFALAYTLVLGAHGSG
ncbi:MAG TPA: EamA family transporter RarD, partial [Spirochaetales bacterium]|nr:EamA family transporter RarD [Spirochaetales bacterium]